MALQSRSGETQGLGSLADRLNEMVVKTAKKGC
jgi:hypothetical protein